MSGGLLQLVLYGAQDMVLTGNPEITFFKLVHRRHTNFAMDSLGQVVTETPRQEWRSFLSFFWFPLLTEWL
jgi:hypothetical protein